MFFTELFQTHFFVLYSSVLLPNPMSFISVFCWKARNYSILLSKRHLIQRSVVTFCIRKLQKALFCCCPTHSLPCLLASAKHKDAIIRKLILRIFTGSIWLSLTLFLLETVVNSLVLLGNLQFHRESIIRIILTSRGNTSKKYSIAVSCNVMNLWDQSSSHLSVFLLYGHLRFYRYPDVGIKNNWWLMKMCATLVRGEAPKKKMWCGKMYLTQN